MGGSISYGSKFVDPQATISLIGLAEGCKVADFGCGAGFFSLACAKQVGENGIIYALDILPERLEAVASQAKHTGLANIVTKRVNLEKAKGSQLENKSADWVIMKDMLFQNKDKKAILAEAKRVVKDDGKILIIEWNMNDSAIGPKQDLRFGKDQLVALAQKIELRVLKEIGVGNFHYGLILEK